MRPNRENLSRIVARIPPSRHLLLGGILSSEDAKYLIRELSILNQNPGDILFRIESSVGGHYDAGISLYKTFKENKCRVVALVDKEASSSAFMAIQGCKLRIARDGSILRIHNPENLPPREPIRYNSKEEEYKERAGEVFRRHHPFVIRNREETIQILMNHFKGKRQELENVLETGNPLKADEALSLGFLDGVINDDAAPA